MSDISNTPEEKAKSGDAIDTRLVRRLADILKATDLTAIEVEQGDLKIRVAREIVVHQMAAAPMAVAAAPAAHAPAPAAAAPTADTTPAAPARAAGDLVKSPMVGTAYMQAQRGNPPFVKVGDKVTEGQTLIIVEAMKTMNPIPAPRAGTVVEILVGDAQPIEFGQPLIVLE
jgi:acetyl-CoA carboxylase biotin carboxyl carrier protein